MIFTCSNKPRPQVQNARGYSMKTGAARWGRDVYHASENGMTTICGVQCSEWIKLEETTKEKALSDWNFCTRCASKL